MPLTLIIAEATAEAATNWQTLVQGGSTLLSLILLVIALRKGGGGKPDKGPDRDSRPQAIEVSPTAIAALAAKIDAAIEERPDMAREMGALTATIETLCKEIAEQRRVHREEISRTHQRIDLISKELSHTTALVESLGRQCNLQRC